jgi:hypothetical protein
VLVFRVILSRCDEESRRTLCVRRYQIRHAREILRKAMKSIKATAIVFCVAIFAALVGANVSAQSPASVPTISAAVGIPEKAPPGWDQAAWTAIRENCERNLLEMARRAQLTAAQRSLLPPLNFSHGDMMLCAHLSVRPQTSLRPSTAAPPTRGRSPHTDFHSTPARIGSSIRVGFPVRVLEFNERQRACLFASL